MSDTPSQTDNPANPKRDAAAKLAAVEAELTQAAQAAGREAEDVTLLAVSKTKPVEHIEGFLAAGQRHFAENRVQEAAQKWPGLRQKYPDIELHLIGPLQSNKVKQAVQAFDVIETLDREKLARSLAQMAAQADDKATFPRLYIQVNSGAEAQKSGILPEDVERFYTLCLDLGLEIDGLMCIPPIDAAAGPHFALLAKLAAKIGVKNLSMGMSADYTTAIGLGATHIRVGTALFGPREAK